MNKKTTTMTKTTTETKHAFANLTPDEKDSLILSAIIGQATLKPEREVKPYTNHDDSVRLTHKPFMDGWGDRYKSGPCCAVGAAILFKNLGPRTDKVTSTIIAFSKFYDVTSTYARGVSHGFEFELSTDCDYWNANYGDYKRGFQVGKAALEALHGGGV